MACIYIILYLCAGVCVCVYASVFEALRQNNEKLSAGYTENSGHRNIIHFLLSLSQVLCLCCFLLFSFAPSVLAKSYFSLLLWLCVSFYASALVTARVGGIMFLVCLSIHPSVCMSVCTSVRPILVNAISQEYLEWISSFLQIWHKCSFGRWTKMNWLDFCGQKVKGQNMFLAYWLWYLQTVLREFLQIGTNMHLYSVTKHFGHNSQILTLIITQFNTNVWMLWSDEILYPNGQRSSALWHHYVLQKHLPLLNTVTQEGEIVIIFSATWLVDGGVQQQGGTSSFGCWSVVSVWSSPSLLPCLNFLSVPPLSFLSFFLSKFLSI